MDDNIHTCYILSIQVCSCPKNYRGDPYRNCQLDPCEDPNTCGQNAECETNGKLFDIATFHFEVTHSFIFIIK